MFLSITVELLNMFLHIETVVTNMGDVKNFAYAFLIILFANNFNDSISLFESKLTIK